MDKDQVADILEEIAILLELKGENPFKTRAYQNGARALASLEEPLAGLVAEGRLGGIPGIGSALQQKITELVTTGRLEYYEELKASIPPGLVELLTVPGLGPKKIKALHEKLGIASVAQLEAACREGKVAGLAGFGEKTQQNLCRGIEQRRTYGSKHLLPVGDAAAEALLESLRNHPDVVRCGRAGSLRRHKEIIADVDLLASSKNPAAVLQFFSTLPQVQSTVARGETKATVRLQTGLQADLRVVSDAEFPFALAYFTGSKEHNIVMRQRAIERGLRLNEYGLFRSEVETRDPALREACRTEEEIFARLGLAFIPPELREANGEFEAAEKGELPRLVEWMDFRGSLHNHSTWSDGRCTLDETAEHMEGLGLDYWAITDHSKASVQANGLDAARLREQVAQIKLLNARLAASGHAFRLLTGVEVDIDAGGSLDLPDDLLAELDVVVASVHQSFTLSESEMTRRLIRAAENPFVHILAHLSGRFLLEREPYKLNYHAVIDACAETGTWLELNANPKRYDLDWRFWPYAKSRGVKCALNCDAHRNEHVAYFRLAAGIARKGWLTAGDIINTLPLGALSDALQKKRARLV